MCWAVYLCVGCCTCVLGGVPVCWVVYLCVGGDGWRDMVEAELVAVHRAGLVVHGLGCVPGAGLTHTLGRAAGPP